MLRKFSPLLCTKVAAPLPKKVDLLNVIDPTHETWTILVRVINKWRVLDNKGSKLPKSVELVLMDAEGNRMHAHINRPYIYKLDKHISEGCVYYVTTFGVGPSLGDYRPTRHEFRLNFNLDTKIQEAASDAVPLPIYKFTPPEECFQGGFDRDYLIDISGVLTGVSAPREYMRYNVKSKLMTIALNNRGYSFNLTLFGNFVDELNTFLSSGEAANAVVVLLWCKVGIFKGGFTLQSTMHSSKLLINPDIPETAALLASIAENTDSPTTVVSQIPDSVTKINEEEFLNDDMKGTIEEMKGVLAGEEREFVIMASVSSVVDVDVWWYLACKCNKKVYPDSNMYFCERCDRHVVSVSPRYLLKLRIIDETDSATVVLFDREAVALIGRSCEAVIESQNNDPERDRLPVEFKALKGKQALFKIHVDGQADGRFPMSFRVKKLSDDRSLIKKYQDKWGPMPIVNDDSPNLQPSNDVHPNIDENLNSGASKGVDDLAQDLLGKFSATDVASTSGANHTDVIDITNDSETSPPLKRSCPFDEGSSSVGFGFKKVKIEK